MESDQGSGPDGNSSTRVGLTRRQVLFGLGVAGVGASTGIGTAGVLTADQRLEATIGAGIIDLETEWLPSGEPITTDEDEGTEAVRFWLPHQEGNNNPAYVWVRTRCPVEANVPDLSISVFLETTDAEYLLLEGVTYEELLAAFGDGRFLHLVDGDILDPLEPRPADAADVEGMWGLRFEWTVTGAVTETGEIDLGLQFHAAQARNVAVTTAGPDYDPGWECTDDSDSEGFSFAAFGANDPLVGADFETLERISTDGSDGEFAVDYELTDDAPDIQEVAIKNATTLYVFDDPDSRADTIDMHGTDGDSYSQDGNKYPDSDPLRTNSDPCPAFCGTFKFEPEGANETNNGCETS